MYAAVFMVLDLHRKINDRYKLQQPVVVLEIDYLVVIRGDVDNHLVETKLILKTSSFFPISKMIEVKSMSK